ncbi:MAG: alpha/beta hydrolase [Hyphomicrobiales bacterium]|nr:alpha/beta hydrolase [Hyphomicrobiales bacterium]MDB5595032.1 alpha/beta hydrolase [Hyphomicrobiales bacterium]
MSFRTETLSLDGLSLRMRRGGSGAPLLYLHGTDGLSEWPAFLDALAERYEVFAPDHPGFGGTECPEWMDDVSDLAYFYLDVMDALGFRDARVVGHSLGGWIALEAAVRNQSRIKDLTLIASAGVHVRGHAKADIFMIDPDEQARLAYADPQMAEEAAQKALADKYQDVAITDRIASARFGWNPRFHNPRLGRWLHRVNAPTLIVWGEQDRIFPPVTGPAMQALIPGSQLVVIPDCGHLPHVEKMDATLAAMGCAR